MSFSSTVVPRTGGGLGEALGLKGPGHEVRVTRADSVEAYRVGGDGQRTWDTDASRRGGYDVLAFTAARAVGAEGPVTLLVGLPLALWLRKDQRRALRERLEGTATWVAEDDGDAAHIAFATVQVLPQGAGAFQAALEDPSLADRPVGLVDVGYRTTDYLLMGRMGAGLAPDEASCGSIDAGAGRIFERVRQALPDRSGVMIPEGAVEEALDHYGGRLYVRGKEIDVAHMMADEAASLSEEIAGQMRRLWTDRLDFLGALILAGGGGVVTFPHLQKLHLLARLSSDPIFANAAGFLGMARSPVQR